MTKFRLLVLALLCAACSHQTAPVEPPRGRVLIVGIDGASMERIDPLIEAGRLPNLKRLKEAGASGLLRSSFPILSPRIWTTVATGVSPERHGIRNWTNKEEPVRLYNAHDRKVHAIWDLASDAGLSVATINWLMTYPAGPVNGIVVSDLAAPGAAKARIDLWTRDYVDDEKREERTSIVEEQGPVTYPDRWRDVVMGSADRSPAALAQTRDPFLDNPHTPPNGKNLSRIAYDRDAWVVHLALEAEKELRPDVSMVLLQGIDRASHWLWGGFVPLDTFEDQYRLTEERAAAYRKMLEAYYVYTDELLGHLLEPYGENDLVIVLSDHGFEAGTSGFFRMTGKHDSEEAVDGVLFARGPGITPNTTLPKGKKGKVRVEDVAPTVLAWMGFAIARDLDGRTSNFVEYPGPIRLVKTYETKPVPRIPFTPSAAEDEALDELRSLGYVK